MSYLDTFISIIHNFGLLILFIILKQEKTVSSLCLLKDLRFLSMLFLETIDLFSY